MRGFHQILAWALPVLVLAAAASAAEISPRLSRRVELGGSAPAWVFLTDKAGSDRDPAAMDYLSARALSRRAKTRRPEVLTDDADLPLSPTYLSFFEGRGWKLRARSRWLNAVSLEVDASRLAELARQPFVESIAAVAASRPFRPGIDDASLPEAAAARDTSIDYGYTFAELQQLRVPEVHAMGYHGEGVVIGMLDTGCNTMHEAIVGADILGTWDFIQGDSVISDQPGDMSGQDDHGSRTFSTLAADLPGSMVGVAFGASYYLAKTEDESGEQPVEEDYWVAGLEWLEAQGCDLVNSSVGYKDWYTYEDLDGDTAVTTVAADRAASLGLLVVAAVGNERFDFGHMIAPSDGDSVLAVGAVDADGDYSWFSSPGPTYDGRIKPDVMARGQDNVTIAPDTWSGYMTVSGTSYCTALMTGVAALLLQANPELTPMQLRDALRETADHAAQPDNDYGWGLVDAVEALDYFRPVIEHDPLPDSENSSSDYPVIATIETVLGEIVSADLFYRINGGSWENSPMSPQGGSIYSACIPAQPWGTQLDYYLAAENDLGYGATHPEEAPDSLHSFYVGEDLQPPVIVHTPLGDQSLPAWPAVLSADVRDNLGVDWVRCESRLNGIPQADFLLSPAGGDLFQATFPYSIAEGDSIRYRILAADLAQAGNEASDPVSGEYAFAIRGPGGLVLLLEDIESDRSEGGKTGSDKEWAPAAPPRERSFSADWIESALNKAGYLVNRQALGAVAPSEWPDYDLLVVSSSDNLDPLAVAGFSAALESYAAEGGHLLCEGGEVAYKFRGDTSFLNTVLHASGWISDYGGNLELVMANHAVANYPYSLPTEIPLVYGHYGDQDVAAPAADAQLVFGTATHPSYAGVIAYDADPDPQGGQSVYLPFNLGELPEVAAKQLVRNAAAWLLEGYTSGSGVVAGNVVLTDQVDASNVTVTLTGQDPLVTASDGVFLFDSVWTGNVLLCARKDGYAPFDSVLTLAEGEVISGVSIRMEPVIVLDYLTQPELPIPDDFPPGVFDTLWVTDPGTLAAITVDMNISHSFIGDLRLVLISPAGTQVVLHDRGGGDADDIVGNYPETLTPVESLDLFEGESITGAWRLRVSDHAAQDVGILHAWGLHLSVPLQPTATEDPPPAFALRGNWPNPFNPTTRLEFSLGKSGRTRLDIFDLRGRRLARLVDESLAAGTYSVLWHGRDRKGRILPSGVYFARLSSGDQAAVRKMLLLK